MPNNNFSPDQSEYYSAPRRKYSPISTLFSGNPDSSDKEERDQAAASIANFRAYAKTALPQKASSENVINAVIEMIPEMRIAEEDYQKRREMSEKARQVLIDCAVRIVAASKGIKLQNRLDAVFFQRGAEDEIKESNTQLAQQLIDNPAERARLLEERVRNAMPLYRRLVNSEITDEELIDNFEQIHIVQDLVANAQKFLSGAEPDKDNKIYAAISPEIQEILIDMERNSAALQIFVDKIRMIANPNYEFLDLDYLMVADNERYEQVEDYAADCDDFVMDDAVFVNSVNRRIKTSLGRDSLMKRIEEDFPEAFQNAMLEFVGFDGQVHAMNYSTDHKRTTIEDNIHKGSILVTLPSGEAACYHLDNSLGLVKKIDSSEIFDKITASSNNVLSALIKGDEGFVFNRSKTYTNALAGMTRAFELVEAAGSSPSAKKMDMATEQLQTVLAECEAYINKKLKGDLSNHMMMRNKMSQRGKIRYDAMRQAADYCRAQLNVYALKRQEMAAKLPTDPVSVALGNEASAKAENVYGAGAALSASNVGTIADDLRADINNSLERMLTGEFNKNEASETLSNMVLLEVIKSGRIMGAGGKVIAGDLEIALADKAEPVVQAMRENAFIQATCQDLTLDTFRQFIVNNGAKALADRITGVAREYNPDDRGNAPQLQNEQDVPVQQNVSTL